MTHDEQVAVLARSLHDVMGPRQGHEHDPETCAAFDPETGVDWADANDLVTHLTESGYCITRLMRLR